MQRVASGARVRDVPSSEFRVRHWLPCNRAIPCVYCRDLKIEGAVLLFFYHLSRNRFCGVEQKLLHNSLLFYAKTGRFDSLCLSFKGAAGPKLISVEIF